MELLYNILRGALGMAVLIGIGIYSAQTAKPSIGKLLQSDF